jgi:hypothetical protein
VLVVCFRPLVPNARLYFLEKKLTMEGREMERCGKGKKGGTNETIILNAK